MRHSKDTIVLRVIFLSPPTYLSYDDDDQHDDDTNAKGGSPYLLNSPATELELDRTESFVLLGLLLQLVLNLLSLLHSSFLGSLLEAGSIVLFSRCHSKCPNL